MPPSAGWNQPGKRLMDAPLRVLGAALRAAPARAVPPGVVLGVPLASSPLAGFDALLATVQMPPGVPVGTLGVGSWGARNAAHLALRVLALADASLARKLEDHAAALAGKGRR